MAAGLVRTTALPSLLDPTPASARAPVASPLISTARPPVASPPAYQAALQQQAMQLHLAKQRLHAEKVDFDKKRAEKLAGEEKERIAKDKINLQKDKDTEEALRRKSGIVGKEDERKGPLPTTMPPHAHRPAASMTLPPPPLPTAPPTSPQMPRPMNPMPPNYNGMVQSLLLIFRLK